MIAFARSSRCLGRRRRPPCALRRLEPICQLPLSSSVPRSHDGSVVLGSSPLSAPSPCDEARRAFSSSSANDAAFSSFSTSSRKSSNTQSLLARTLYRQLLRWCDAAGNDVPLDPIPPFTLVPPRVDGEALRSLSAAMVSDGGSGAHWYDGDGGGEQSSVEAEAEAGSSSSARIERLCKEVPLGTIADEDMITMPVESVSDVRRIVRVAYGLNAAGAADRTVLHNVTVPPSTIDPQIAKDRVDLAFEALRSLNELSRAIDDRRAARERNADRTGVMYSIGQVLRHRGDRWRGVVCGWRRRRPSGLNSNPGTVAMTGAGRSTSLTSKDYSSLLNIDPSPEEKAREEEEEEEVFYDFVLDQGDAHMLGGRSRSLTNASSPFPMVAQSDLEVVEETSLRRIRSNWIAPRFRRYDAETGWFVPNDVLAYEYPSDVMTSSAQAAETTAEGGESAPQPSSSGSSSKGADIVDVSRKVIEGVKGFASRLERRILEATSCPQVRNLGLLEDFRRQLSALSAGNVRNAHERMTSPPSLADGANDAAVGTAVTDAAQHLRPLLRLSVQLSEMLWQRRVSSEHKSSVVFPLGSIVRHRGYGYRGVVVAWDPKPAVDVSRWDGLRDVENPMEQPFYHVVPDRNDCVRAFGGERPFRYVCQENLEACPIDERASLELLDMDPGWERTMEGDAVSGVAVAGGSGGWRYEPPDELKFKYAEDLGDDGEIMVEAMTRMKEDITQLHLAIRDGDDDIDDESVRLQARSISMDHLFALLQSSDNIDDAVEIEECIKEIWKAHSDFDVRCRLDDGIAELLRGNKEKALSVFTDLVADDPSYFQAWNKKATCHFMLGEMELSMEAARRTVELCPRHFQAMSGLGLVQYETRRYALAAESFRRSIGLDPWSPVSSRLAACLDLLEGMDLDSSSSLSGGGGGTGQRPEVEEEEEEGAEEGSAPYQK